MPTEPKPQLGRIALVTGAAQGIGAAIAARLGQDGARVGVNGLAREAAAVDSVVAQVSGFPALADVCDRDAVTNLVTNVEDRHGPIGILVCNAAYMSMAAFGEDDEDDWWKVIDTNLVGTFHLIQAVLPGMRRLGRGNVVVISSEWGVTGWPNASAYSASKAGLIALVKTLGRELAPEGISVNAVAPGVIDTPQLHVDAESAGVSLASIKDGYAAATPVGRIGQPAEIAAAVALLAQPELNAFVGQTIQINGGTTRCRV